MNESNEEMLRELEELRSKVRSQELSATRDWQNEAKAGLIKLVHTGTEDEERTYIDILLEKLLAYSQKYGWNFHSTEDGDHDFEFTRGRSTIKAKFDFDVQEFYSGVVQTELESEISLFRALEQLGSKVE